MFNFIIECISLSIISLIVISVGYYIYDYCVSKNENINNKKQLDEINSEINDINIDELESLINGKYILLQRGKKNYFVIHIN